MNLFALSFSGRRLLAATTILSCFLAGASIARAGTMPALLDDFSDTSLNRIGLPRMLIDDKTAGSQSHATLTCEKGILRVEGELIPGRGAPAFISLVSLLSAEGKAQDLSAYEGVRLRVKPGKGLLTVQVSSTEVQNFDFHASAPIVGKAGEFSEVRLPFKEMKRNWSEQSALNLKSITSINLVCFAMAKDAFDYEVDEISFY